MKDFNIKIIKLTNKNGEVEYFYACNNKKENVIDLISVAFIGHQLVETDYKRQTMNEESYLQLVSLGVISDVTPYELQRFAQSQMNKVYEQDFSKDEEFAVVLCDNCACEEGECQLEEESSSEFKDEVDLKLEDGDDNIDKFIDDRVNKESEKVNDELVTFELQISEQDISNINIDTILKEIKEQLEEIKENSDK